MLPLWMNYCHSARTTLRMTHAEAAAVVGVTRRTWAGWEAGEHEPPEWRKEQVRETLACELVAVLRALAEAHRKHRRSRD